MTMKKIFLSMLFFTFCIKAQVAKDDSLEPIGPTQIRFYTGNLSGGMVKCSSNDYSGMTDEIEKIMKRISCTVMCDYITWCSVEQKQKKWDWSFHIENAKKLNAVGLGYNVFCWLHFPPKWYKKTEKYVPYVNIENGKSIPQISLWSPDIPEIFENFYSRLSQKLGDKIEFMRLAMPTEYGEIGYCAGMTKWLCEQKNAEAGYWCGDKFAKKDFRESMLKLYGSLGKINKAWNTNFKSVDKIFMPDTKELPKEFGKSVAARKRWIDFIEWYQQAWVICLRKTTKIVKKHFPKKELIASLGYGTEFPKLGNDQGRHIEAMSNLGLACQSPGDIGYFPTRRVSSACRHFKVPYFTEPPAGVSRERELNRIFMDISNGVETWFDYLPNMDQARDYFRKYKKHLTGTAPKTTVAIWHPTLDHWLHPEDAWSKPAIELSEPLRDVLAYEIVDDRMIKTGALKTLKVRQLILAGATWLDSAAWKKVHDWVKTGGVLIVLQSEPISDISGNTDLWKKQYSKVSKKMGKGIVITIDPKNLSQNQLAELVGKLCESAGEKVGHPEWNAKHINGKVNSILSTIFENKLLYFNTTKKDKKIELNFREKDFPKNAKRPKKMKLVLEIPARTIVEVPLIAN